MTNTYSTHTNTDGSVLVYGFTQLSTRVAETFPNMEAARAWAIARGDTLRD